GGPGLRARQVGDGGGDLLGGDQSAHGLAGLQRGPLRLGVVGGVEEPAHPGGVGGAGVDAGDADALGEVVGGHGEGEGVHRALAGGVQGALRQPGGGRDRAGVDDRGVAGGAQQRQRGAGGAHDAQHVDVEDAVPLLVRVVLDGAGGADARVVDEDVQAAEVFAGLAHGRAHRGVVPHVGGVGADAVAGLAGPQVQHGDAGAFGGEQAGGGQADARAAAGDEGGESHEPAHASPPAFSPAFSPAARSAAQNVPSGKAYVVSASGRRAAEKPGAVGAA